MARSRTPSTHPADVHASSAVPLVLIAAAGALAYANSLTIPFLLDDLASIVDNTQIRGWPGWRDLLFTLPNTTVAGRPVVLLSLAFNHAVGGLDVRGYHVLNLAVHIACGLLIFGIVRRTLEAIRTEGTNTQAGRTTGVALATALIWVVHPLGSEVVDYVVQRTESLMALFYLLTFYAAIRGLRSAHASAWQTMAVACCALGMLAKESMVTAPVLLVLYDSVFAFGSLKRALGARGRFYAALSSTWVIFAALAAAAPRAEVVGLSSGVSPWTYLLNQMPIIVRYLRLALWPRGLVAFYGWPQPVGMGDLMPYTLIVLLLFGLTVAGMFVRPRVAFLGIWFFVTLAPASSIVPIATEVGAERRMYLPLAAVVLAVVIGGVQLWERFSRRSTTRPSPSASRTVGAITTAVVVAALTAATLARNREYASTLDLARTIVERRPTSIAHHILGQELAVAGHHELAIAELREAAPGDSKARYLLGLELFTMGKWADAIDELERFVATAGLPYRLVPHWLEPSATEVVNARLVIGRAASKLERWALAIEQAQKVLAMNRSNAEAYGLMGDAFFAERRFDEAAVAYRQYVSLRPGDSEGLNRLGAALMIGNNASEGVAMLKRAVEVDPRNGEAQRNLATALLDGGDLDGASTHARAAVELRPQDAVAHEMLGRALAAQGLVEEAVRELERALALDPNDEEARAALARLSSSGSSRRPRF